jgi:phosphate transport system ATP-binding protein
MSLDPSAPALETRRLSLVLGTSPVLRNVSVAVPQGLVVAFVGPSGCGKSALLRCFGRMNEVLTETRLEGQVLFHGQDLYGAEVDPAEVRRRIGMVFQKPSPFPNSIFENVAFGPRVNRSGGDLNRIVEESLRKAGLWDEVSDRLFDPAGRLSPGQQQRLCIARALAVDPEVLLLDEPTSDLDPGGTRRIEEMVHALKGEYTIVLATHNLQQAARISDFTAFLDRGELIEFGPTKSLFTNPGDPRTEAFLTGRSR